MKETIEKLKIEGELFTDNLHRSIYSTDASSYRVKPLAVAVPATTSDIVKILEFCSRHKIEFIARGSGTSLAGQAIGKGIIVDFSKNFNKILEINAKEKWCRVQPGVILSDLNKELSKFGLFFGPETSTANRVTLGGMFANNACGLHSLVYGSVRDHIISARCILSNGEIVEFGEISKIQFDEKLNLPTLEGQIYRKFNEILSDRNNVEHILETYPPKSLKRRNTGYALDFVADTEIFSASTNKLNLSKFLAGSEGTLAIVIELKLNLVDLPPKHKALMCVHFDKLYDAFYANIVALRHSPTSVELMDKKILDLTKDNLTQQKNRFFIEGDPEAILIVEFTGQIIDEISERCQNLKNELLANGYGYAFPVIWNDDVNKIWDLRKSGLGVLSNLPGDARPVSLVEDTAVDVNVLPDYVKEFDEIMQKYSLSAVYHAHIGTGELHLRPILNLKNSKDIELSRKVATEIALLVKKYKGSLSGEHGDGRLRSEFIPLIYGDKIYQWFREIKYSFDPDCILNRGVIVDAEPMDNNLRYKIDTAFEDPRTVFDFSQTLGYLRAAEKCNGSADCRKSFTEKGTMCPSFQATRDEYFATRARANALREFLTYGKIDKTLTDRDIYDILSNCLSCKACKSECPSNVDITKLKAEFLQMYYDKHFASFRSILVANFPLLNSFMSLAPSFFNWLISTKLAKFFAAFVGFEKQRNLPLVHKPLTKIFKSNQLDISQPTVYLFADEFTNLNDTDIGIKAILLLTKLGYNVVIPKLKASGRTYLSKGFVRKAKRLINNNIEVLSPLINEKVKLIGVEPSAILTFRDEAIDLANDKDKALKIAQNTMLIDEFIYTEIQNGNIKPNFKVIDTQIKIHTHCYQKALSSSQYTIKLLEMITKNKVEEIKSGCCGMAGAFGYEKEHYHLSQKIGELVLFPAIRSSSKETIFVANGTSCRHQILEGTNIKAKHIVEILYEALN